MVIHDLDVRRAAPRPDALKETYGQDSLRYALTLTSLVNVWAAIHFILAANAYAKEIAAKT